jgi:hypothetical protein
VNRTDESIQDLLSPIVYKKIRGVIGVSEMYSELYGKHVYLFDDFHIAKKFCEENKDTIDIDKLIQKTILQNQDKMIDVFIEIFYDVFHIKMEDISKIKFNSGDSEATSYMIKSHELLQECSNVKKKDCNYDNLRYHVSDIRFKSGVHFDMRPETFLMDKEIFFDLFGEEKTTDLHRKRILQSFKINRQLQAIEDEKVKSFIEHEIALYFETSEKLISQLRTYFKQSIFNARMEDTKIHLMKHLMNFYILARMFRSFKKEKDMYSEPANNIIVYAGGDHVLAIISMLKKLKFSMVFSNIDSGYEDFMTLISTAKDKQDILYPKPRVSEIIDRMKNAEPCIDITRMKQPLFGGYKNPNPVKRKSPVRIRSPAYMSKSKCMSYKKAQLIKMCSEKKLNTDGTKQDLCKRLMKSPVKPKSPVRKSPKKSAYMSKSKCMSYKKAQLIKMCSEKKLNTNGTKQDLCKRLLK